MKTFTDSEKMALLEKYDEILKEAQQATRKQKKSHEDD